MKEQIKHIIGLMKKDNYQFVLEVNKMIVGYMNVGPTDDAEYNNCCEINAIYIIV